MHTFLYYLQRFGLSAAFFYMAYGRAWPMFDRARWRHVAAVFDAYSATSEQALVIVQQITQNCLLIAFNCLIGGLLLAARRPDKPPERLLHVIVPLMATFSYLAYGYAEHLPRALHELRLLPDLGLVATFVPGLLVMVAYALSLAAALTLRRSFAVFVEVRVGVTGGPFRFVRHPMYLGYVLVITALFISQPTAAYALLSIVLTAITILRARLEEQMLAAHVPEYAEYMKRTGMLFPRIAFQRTPPSA